MLNNRQDIPSWCEQVAFIERGEITVLGQIDSEQVTKELDRLLTPRHLDKIDLPLTIIPLKAYQHQYLAELNNCRVTYDNKAVFENLNVTIAPLQHTLITGNNGSGKSTLMHLITGDCPQCFSNDVTVLGFRRGNGESIWDLKKHMGIVSSELHRQYRVRCSVLTVVCSGFNDSIGLYEQIDNFKIRLARQWLAVMNMSEYEQTLFQQLSYGEQRLILIARALVKSPLLLILDEPTQGLDELNRHLVLNFLEKIAELRHSTIVFVSHREDEFIPLFQQHIHLT